MLPDLTTFTLFAVACMALYVSPGPDMLYIASRSLGQGRRAGVLSACGICTGLLFHTTVAGFGLSALLVVWPFAYQTVKWLGVVYLLYLGLRALTRDAGAAPGINPTTVSDSFWRVYSQGALVNVLNPKIALFFLAFLPQFVDPARGNLAAQTVTLGFLFTLGGLVWTLFLALVFGRLGDWLGRHPGAWKWQRCFSGSVLIAVAAQLAFTDRR